ncbi:ribonuclease P [Thermogymnomonas acidicola]|uniref:Ribonuclease P protein component 1 n=1 Tax=Thermogymnomonas acidicola TaxID=399579 RepID=A0AA37BR00_9ARCH|nr:ribonuclease P protein subunit [Thermogymnomonas acidicola]GGM72018.1 ribonuclease P [Thermogymnomonas acidicola]
MRNLRDYLDDLIGYHCEVVRSSNSALVGIGGKIVDETRNMVYIGSGRRVRAVPKGVVTLKISKPGREVYLKGPLLCYRPEDRLKESRRIERNLRRGGVNGN